MGQLVDDSKVLDLVMGLVMVMDLAMVMVVKLGLEMVVVQYTHHMSLFHIRF